MKEIGRKASTALEQLREGYASVARNTIDYDAQPLGRHVQPDGLAGYFCDLRHKSRESVARMSAEGPSSPYAWSIPIAQAALGFWDLRIEGEEVEEDFLALADWFVENHEESTGGVVWRSHIPVPKYGLSAGWISAMGQGQAISVLLRAAQLTGEESYAELADAAFVPMMTPVSEGGTLGRLGDIPVLEEYPTESTSAVLNGWVFALWGVHELATVRDSADARRLFEQSATGLISLIPRYDIGWWTLYSLYDHGRRDLAKPFYQDLHAVMMEGLDLIHPDPSLAYYASRWRAQRTHIGTIRASADKLFFRIYREFR